jgi:hypothetical protein
MTTSIQIQSVERDKDGQGFTVNVEVNSSVLGTFIMGILVPASRVADAPELARERLHLFATELLAEVSTAGQLQ